MTTKEIDDLAVMHPRERLIEVDDNSHSITKTPSDPGLRLNSGSRATVASVTAALQEASIVHLACHAKQQRRDPLRSGFVLHDGSLTVADLARIRMPHAFFAFLSVCESATGDEELPDEIVHLAGTMLFTGFRSVVGTMWY
jgi:CHAT domain-containing protein